MIHGLQKCNRFQISQPGLFFMSFFFFFRFGFSPLPQPRISGLCFAPSWVSQDSRRQRFDFPGFFYVRFQLCSWTVMSIYLDTWVQGTFQIRCPRVEYALLPKKIHWTDWQHSLFSVSVVMCTVLAFPVLFSLNKYLGKMVYLCWIVQKLNRNSKVCRLLINSNYFNYFLRINDLAKFMDYCGLCVLRGISLSASLPM